MRITTRLIKELKKKNLLLHFELWPDTSITCRDENQECFETYRYKGYWLKAKVKVIGIKGEELKESFYEVIFRSNREYCADKSDKSRFPRSILTTVYRIAFGRKGVWTSESAFDRFDSQNYQEAKQKFLFMIRSLLVYVDYETGEFDLKEYNKSNKI